MGGKSGAWELQGGLRCRRRDSEHAQEEELYLQIAHDLTVHRLGFGTMRITGLRVWGPPLDMAEAIRTLKRLPEIGIDFIGFGSTRP